MPILAALVLLAAAPLRPLEMQPLWQFGAEAPHTRPPVIGDLHPATGLETAFVDTGTGSIVVLDGRGRVLWAFDGEFRAPDGPGLAFKPGNDDSRGKLLAVDDAGTVIALAADLGTETWRFDDEPLRNATPHWADLDGDGLEEAVFCAPDRIVALDAEGLLQWSFDDTVHTRELEGLRGITIGDVDDDFAVEIFTADAKGLLCLDNFGMLRWELPVDGEITAFPMIAPVLGEGGQAIVLLTAAPELQLRDVTQGALRHTVPLSVALRDPGAIALADLQMDGLPELLVADGNSLLVIDAAGREYRRVLDAPGIVRLACGDTDGDGYQEIYAAGSTGVEILNARESSRLSAPAAFPMLADLNGDNALDLLLAGADKQFLVFSNGQAVRPLRHNARSPQGNPFHARNAEDGADWVLGEASLRRDDAGQMRLPAGTKAVRLLMSGTGALPGGSVLRWLDDAGGLIHEHPLAVTEAGEHRLDVPAPPIHAARAEVILEMEDGADWEITEATAQTRQLQRIGVLINQVGYEVAGPKSFVAWSNFQPGEARFQVIDRSGVPVREDILLAPARVAGPNGGDWGAWYSRGDFSLLNEPGQYHVRVLFDGFQVLSPAFRLEVDLLWRALLAPVVDAVSAHRCGTISCTPSAPAIADIEGGWANGSGCAREENGAIARDLLMSYAMNQWRFNAPDGRPLPRVPLLEEALFGLDYLRREADALAQAGAAPGDSALYAVALAAGVRFAPEAQRAAIEAAAVRLLEELRAKDIDDPLLFAAATSLATATGDAKYAEIAKELLPDPAPELAESLVEFEALGVGSATVTFKLGLALEAASKEIIARAANPFGLYPAGAAPNDYFATPDQAPMPQGNTITILAAAQAVASSYRFTAHPEFATFVYDQLNWLLGVNPFGVSLVQGLGNANAPMLPGACVDPLAHPGLVLNGISGRAPGDPTPHMVLGPLQPEDIRTNGYQLTNTAKLLRVLAHMKRIRLGQTPG